MTTQPAVAAVDARAAGGALPWRSTNAPRRLIPGATQLISRRPTRAALGVSPIYAERAKGCRIWDVDGNEYVDWFSAVGPIVLGYANDVVDAAVKEQIERGSIYSIVHESAVELAEMLVRLVPSAEMVRYAKAGARPAPWRCASPAASPAATRSSSAATTAGTTGTWRPTSAPSASTGTSSTASSRSACPRALEGSSLPFATATSTQL